MIIKLLAIAFIQTLVWIAPIQAANHLSMAERKYGDEADAWEFFEGSANVPASSSFPLWQNLASSVGLVTMGKNVFTGLETLYAVNPDDNGIYRYMFPKYDDDVVWEKIGGPGKQFVVANENRLFGVSPDGSGVYEWTGNKWIRIGGATQTLYGGDFDLYRTVPGSGDIYIYDDVPNNWRRVGGPGAQFAAGGNKKLYGISVTGNALYQWSGQVGAQWTRIRDNVKEVYAAGDAVFAVDAVSGDIFRYEGGPFSWTRIGGPGKQFAVVSNDLLYGISPDGNGIYRYFEGRWDRIGEAADAIYASGEELIVKAANGGSLWRHLETDPRQADYIVVVPDEATATAARTYVAWKKAIGFDVSVVTLDDVDRAAEGRDEAERIRNFLIDNNLGALRYLMLVGNVDVIPSRLLYPGDDRSNNLAYVADYYYADLHTTNWDLDGDGLWGEFTDDEYNSEYDVAVGRLPHNTLEEVSDLLANVIAFEQDDRPWKKNTLQAAGFMDAKTDNAELSQAVDRDFFSPNGWQVDKLYINEPLTQSIFSSLPGVQRLTGPNYLAALASQTHSLIYLGAHGGPTGMQSRDTNAQRVTNHTVNFSRQENLENIGISAIVMLNGCSTAPPLAKHDGIDTERSLFNMVGKETLRHNGDVYLEQGAVAVVGATAGSDYSHGWASPSDPNSSTLFYMIQENIADRNLTAGDALFEAQRDYADTFGLERGIRVFYLLGDPTVKISGVGRQ